MKLRPGRLSRRSAGMAVAAVALVAAAAVALGSFVPFPNPFAEGPKTRLFEIEAHQFGYDPERIRVNKGDEVIIQLTAQDVVHGLYIDGYGLEVWAEPGRTGTLRFTADRAGTFRFRCSKTCGVMHPFTIGQLSVEPNTPFWSVAAAVVLVAVGAVAYGWSRGERDDGSSN